MKTKTLIAGILLATAAFMRAATNDLTSALQKGLFEEEANHNLEAAAQAYQAVSARFDQDRKLAATAIFRLGEVYRKQGKTNEATAQYERIVREFSDQQTLVTLSRQNLGGPSSVVTITGLQKAIADEQEASRLGAQLVGIEHLKEDPEEQARAVLAFFPDEILKKMLLQLPKLKEQEAIVRENPTLQYDKLSEKLYERLGSSPTANGSSFHTAYSPDGLEPERHGTNFVTDAHRELTKQLSWIKERVAFTVGIQKARLQVLQAVAAKTSGGEATTSETSALTTDDEEKEIRRIQTMIQNSPDLINAPPAENGVTPLCNAARNGQLRVAKYLLDAGALVDLPCYGSSPIHNATAGGHKAMVELLLDRGADANLRDSSGKTPLHLAAENGFQSVMETLLARKADVNAQTKKQETPLLLAAAKGHSAMVDLLIAKGAQLDAKDARGWTALTAAASQGHALVVKRLLDARTDPNIPDGSGRTALSYAVQRGHTDAVKALLESKADPNAGSADSPLLLAVRAENAALMELLLRAGADPNQATACDQIYMSRQNMPRQSVGSSRQNNGKRVKRTPLQAAVLEEYPAMAKLLLQFKGDAKAKNDGGSPLVLEALSNPEILKALLEAGADANARYENGPVALIVAAANGNSAAVELLVNHGADANVRDDQGRTPLFFSADKDDKKSVELLLNAKADVNAVETGSLATALHHVVNKGSGEIVEMLLAHGANPNLKDNTGNTPLHRALGIGGTGIGAQKMVELLLSKGADPNLRNNDGRTALDLAKGVNSPPAPGFGGFGQPLPGVPTRPVRQPADGESSAKTEAVDIPTLLRKHGALDDLPKLDRIEVQRASANYSAVVFQMGTNDWNEFGLLELIALHYGLISTDRNAVWEVNRSTLPSNLWRAAACQFPDLSHIVIRRPSSAGPQRSEMAVNVAELLDAGDCARDVKLNPGDIIEIPEADHPVNEKWPGLCCQQLSNLLHCVSRTVTISIKGTPTTNRLAPQFKLTNSLGPYGERMGDLTRGSFMLKSVLAQSRLLRASSDLSRVKVTRRAGVDGKPREWVLNCSSGNDPDLWLRDGDVIEVPDKL